MEQHFIFLGTSNKLCGCCIDFGGGGVCNAANSN